MAIEKKQIPFAPFKGLYLDGVTVPGGLSKAENVIILPDGTAERRPFERTLADTQACEASQGTKEVFELKKNDGTRYIYADLTNSETYTTAFGDEEISKFSSWTPTSGWSWDAVNLEWDHASGTTALVATGETAVVAATQYQVVVDVTCPTPSLDAGNWAYTVADSGYTWTTETGSSEVIWLQKWAHSSGDTVALTTTRDFTPEIGASYYISVHVTHTSGTGLVVSIGGKTLGTIASSGTHTYTARFCTAVTPLKFTPSSDWVGSINKTVPRVKSKLDNWVSVVKLLNPAGTTDPSNWDYSESTHTPPALYLNGAELINIRINSWFPKVAAMDSQSIAVSLGATAAGTITKSGVYTYDVTSTNTTALTFTPTTSWVGSINSASVKKRTQSAAASKGLVIGGVVTGTTDYEVTWGNILSDLTSGNTVHPQWTALQDRAFRVDGNNPNYWFEDATYYHKLGCPAPADAPLTANTTGGDLLAGDYNVYYTYVKRYDNNYVVEGNPSPAAYTTVTDTAITITVTACTEADVTNIRIYRTLYNEPGSYAYFDQEISNETTSVTIQAGDDNIRSTLTTLEIDHDVPPLGKYVLGAGSRLWIVDTDGTLHWSVLDQPELMPSQNYQTFDPKDGDEMMGLCPLRKHLLVFKRRRTWLLDLFSESVSDDGVAALAKDVVSSNYGCIATGSIQPVGTDAAIWLSHAGFILYNGGSIKNISGGGIDADGNMMPSRIQDVINDFLAGGAEHFIDSAYHTARQLYHVNFLTRNAAGDEITEQRHFVYNLQSDSWTEYVYRDSDGDKMYETNFAMAHDSLGNEVILIPYISSTTGTVTYVYQGEYTITVSGRYTELLDSTGADGEGLDKPIRSFCDDDDNVYVIDSIGNVFMVTSAGVKSLLVKATDIQTAVGYAFTDATYHFTDIDNDCFYLELMSGSYLVKITLDGEITKIYSLADGTGYEPIGLNSDGTIMYVLGSRVTSACDKLYAITNIGEAEQAITEIHDFGTYTDSSNLEEYSAFTIYGDALYYVSRTKTAGNYTGTFTFGVLGDLSGTPANETHDTSLSVDGILGNITVNEIVVKSSTEIYIMYSDIIADPGTTGTGNIYRGLYGNDSWTFDAPIDAVSASFPGLTVQAFSIRMKIRSDESFVLCGVDNNVYIYNSDWELLETLNDSEIVLAGGASYNTTNEDIVNICGFTSDNVYQYDPGSIDIIDDEPTLKNTVIHITSNYTDLGIPNEKRITRAYLDIDCKYPGCGAFYLEPDYGINYYTHEDNETAEPTGSVSMRPFQHYGHRTWTYTNSSFTSSGEQWQPTRLDVGTRGNAFRYTIRAGDVSTNVTGIMRIRPPKIMVQVKELK